MTKAGDYTISNIYQGGYSSFKAYPSLSQDSSTQNIGISTDARTANILKEVSDNLSSGAKTVELNQVFPEVFEAVPKEQLEEVRRVAKLAGSDITFHAPIVGLDPSGMDKQGNFSETQRKVVERKMINAIERAQVLKPEGGLPITFHAAEGVPETYPEKVSEEDKEVYVVNTETKALGKLPLRKRYLTGGQELNIKEELQKVSKDSWTQNLQNFAYYADYGEKLIQSSEDMKKFTEAEKKAGKPIDDVQKESIKTYDRGVSHLYDSYRRLGEFYETAYRNCILTSNKKDKKILDEFEKSTREQIKQVEKGGFNTENIGALKEIVDKGESVLKEINPPEIFKPINEFAEEKATKTFGNVAFEAYKKFGDKAPMVLIENSYAGGAFSKGEDLKKVVEGSKKEFIKNAVESGKFSKSEAEKQADKIIGATWDVGRLNTLRQHGFDEKEIIKETEKIAPLVKHVHLSDNFGMEGTELPMGMGNVPMKEIMAKLGEKGFEGKKVIEALHWWQHFSPGGKQNPPLQKTFEAMGSPIYSDGLGPYWNQSIGLQQDYYGGYGLMLPSVHYNMQGSGFSMASLPTELGGQVQGAQGSRMSGRGME